ncbi:MAG: mannosyltransferase [Mycobacteriaceae bacterium]
MTRSTRSFLAGLVHMAPAVLLISIVIRLLWTLCAPNGRNLVDLHVYVDGAASLSSGGLYNFTFSQYTPDFPLPFTYPPFAALVFYPLHFLPFAFIGILWQLMTILALFGVARISQKLLTDSNHFDGYVGRDVLQQDRNRAMLWTAAMMWSESLRTTFDYGQVNVFLVLAVLVAVYSSSWWLSGLLVGFAAGIKLTPAVASLYFLAKKRWRAALAAAATFIGTIAVSYAVISEQTRFYFQDLLGDASRIGPVLSVTNQSLRGALGRAVGHDVKSGPILFAAVLIVAVLAFSAWRVLPKADRLGALMVVELFGLLVSPISWIHHWVWIIPLLIWLRYGSMRKYPGAQVIFWMWLVVQMAGVPWLLSFVQDRQWVQDHTLVFAFIAAINVWCTVATLMWIVIAGHRSRSGINVPRQRQE